MRMKFLSLAPLAASILLGSAAFLPAADPANPADLARELKGELPLPERSPQQLEAVYAQVIDSLMPSLGNDDPGKRSGPQSTLEQIAFHAGHPGGEPGRLACSKVIAAKLGRVTEPLGRIWLLKQLERIGRAEAVPAVAPLLGDPEAHVRESARRALQKNPAPEANTALQQALAAASTPAWRAALMNALAERADLANFDLLAKGAASDDDALRVSALIGLSKLGDKSALAPIAAARLAGSDASKRAATDCALRLAGALAARGDKASALSVYQTLLHAEGHLKCAALIGIGRAGNLADLPVLLEAAADPDAKVRGACVEALSLLQGPQVTESIATKMPAAQPDTKVALLQALARRGDKSAAAVFVSAAADADPAVQAAAVGGLGSLGTPAQAPLLLTLAANGAKPVQDAARQSLQLLAGIDTALTGALQQPDAKFRAEAARALAARHAVAATGSLLQSATDADGTVRNESLRALGAVAPIDALAPLAAVLVKTDDAGSRSEAAEALVSIATRSDALETRAQPLLKALAGATGPARHSLLGVLGRIGGQNSLAALRAAIQDPDPKTQDAGVRALADWPDASAASDLLDVVKTSPSQTHQVLAFRGYVRICRIRAVRPEPQTARMLAAGLALAKRPDQKRDALGGLAEVRDLSALQIVEPFLDDPSVKDEAASAAVRIGRDIASKNPAAVKAVMQKVLGLTKNTGLQRDATEALDRAERKLKENAPKK